MAERPETTASSEKSTALTRTMGHRYFLLFVFLLGYLICYPYAQNSSAGYYTFRLFAIAVTLLSVYAVSVRRSLILVALVLAVPDIVEHIQLLPRDTSVISLLNISLTFVFDAFIIVVIFRQVFVHGRATAETIMGALCIYLLVGYGFSTVYGLLNIVQPHAFYMDPVVNMRTTPMRFDFIYYSFGTMTSLGAPGITAVSDQARSISVMEAILGVLYLAVMIARLMGAYQSTHAQKQA